MKKVLDAIADWFLPGTKRFLPYEQVVMDAILDRESNAIDAFRNVLNSFHFFQRGVGNREVIFYRKVKGKVVWEEDCHFAKDADVEMTAVHFTLIHPKGKIRGDLAIVGSVPCFLHFNQNLTALKETPADDLEIVIDSIKA